MAPSNQHRCLDWLSEATASLILVRQDDYELEDLRKDVLKRRDTAILACAVEILVSVASMALYDIRRSIIVPIANTVLAILASIGLFGALALQLPKIQVHGVVTTGLLIACLVNFVCEALLTNAGMGTDTLPGWLVLLFLLVPYSINLACSILSVMLGPELEQLATMMAVHRGIGTIGESRLLKPLLKGTVSPYLDCSSQRNI
ncbi:Birc2 [Symbiodinium natans]|uniref:Birc2 protein n=1 Tax=Symbiodinium natans TaxID=878477 RepID=A0A812T539_9DINO|nr:Birc2 [Symbiodinium natans]